MTRLLAALLAVFFLGLVALMASVTLFVRDPMPVLGTRAPISFANEEGTLRATVAADPTYRLEITVQSPPEAPAPELTLRQGSAEGRPVPLQLTEGGAGILQATGQFTAPGRWTLQIDGPGGAQSFGFILQE